MTSNTQPSQKLRRNGSPSTNKSSGPLRATIPVSLMSQSVIHDVPEDPHLTHSSQSAWSKINLPHPVVSPANTLQCGIPKQTPWRMRQWSPTPIKGLLFSSTVQASSSSSNTLNLLIFSGEPWAHTKDWWLPSHEENCFPRCHLSERPVAQRNSRLWFKSSAWQSHTNTGGMDGWFEEVISCCKHSIYCVLP